MTNDKARDVKTMREARELLRQHIDAALAARESHGNATGLTAIEREVAFCQSVIRNPTHLRIELLHSVWPEFMQSPATRRLWEGMLFADSMGDGCGVASLHKHDWMAFLLSEWLVDRWSEDRVELHAFAILESAVERGFFDDD